MRLPWPFGRSQAAPAETEPTIDAGPAELDTALPPAFPGVDAAAPPTGAWSRLPPIQRATGDPPLVAPASTFLEDVPGANQLPPIIGQLGHDVTPLAPVGLVAAQVHPVPSLTSNASLVPRPVQRHASEAEPEPAAEPQPAPHDPEVQRSPATSPSPTAVAAAVAPPGPRPATSDEPAAAPTPPAIPFVEEPIRHLSVVAPEGTSDVPTRSLTRADAWTPPSTAERPLAHRTNVQTSRSASPATTASSTTAASASGPAPSAPATTSPTPATPSAGDGPAARPVRRAGLGAPLAVAPSTAVQRTPSGGLPGGHAGETGAGRRTPGLGLSPLAGASPLPASVQRRGAAARSAAAGGDGTGATPVVPDRAGSRQAPFVGSPRSGGLPSLPVVSRSSMHDAVDAAGEPTTSPAAGLASTEASAAGPRPSMPLVGSAATAAADVRAAPTATAQRAPGATPPAPAAPGRRPLVGAHPLGPSLPSSAGDGGPAPAAAEPPFPGVSTSGEGTVLWSNPLVNVTSPFPAVQREPAADAVGGPAIADGQRPALIPATPHVQPSRREAGPMTLARPQAAITAALAAQDGGATSSRATGQASTGAVTGPNNTTMVQMTPAQALASPVIAPTATAVVQRADGAPPPADADEGEEKSESELEDLARAIFPRIQRQLRMQYVYEREARGLPFDP